MEGTQTTVGLHVGLLHRIVERLGVVEHVEGEGPKPAVVVFHDGGEGPVVAALRSQHDGVGDIAARSDVPQDSRAFSRLLPLRVRVNAQLPHSLSDSPLRHSHSRLAGAASRFHSG